MKKSRIEKLKEKYPNLSFTQFSLKYFNIIPIPQDRGYRYLKKADRNQDLRLELYKEVSNKVHDITGNYLKYLEDNDRVIKAAEILFTKEELAGISNRAKVSKVKNFFRRMSRSTDIHDYLLKDTNQDRNCVDIDDSTAVKVYINNIILNSDFLEQFDEKEAVEIVEQFFLLYPKSAPRTYEFSKKDSSPRYLEIIKKVYTRLGVLIISNINTYQVLSNPEVISDKEFVEIIFSQLTSISRLQLTKFSSPIIKLSSGQINKNSVLRRRLLWLDKATKASTKNRKYTNYSFLRAIKLAKNPKKSDSRKLDVEKLIHDNGSLDKIISSTSRIGYDYFISRINSLLINAEKNVDIISELKILETLEKVSLRERSDYKKILKKLVTLHTFLLLYPTTEADYCFLEKRKRIPTHSKFTKYLPYSENSGDIINQLRFELKLIIKELLERISETTHKESSEVTIPEELENIFKTIPLVSCFNNDSTGVLELYYEKFVAPMNISSKTILTTFYEYGSLEKSSNPVMHWFEVSKDYTVTSLNILKGKSSIGRDIKCIIGLVDMNRGGGNLLRAIFGSESSIMLHDSNNVAIIYIPKENIFYFISVPNNQKLNGESYSDIAEELVYIFDKYRNSELSIMDLFNSMYTISNNLSKSLRCIHLNNYRTFKL